MSQFSNFLNDLVHEREISVKSLADSCGIDRTLLHKILSGKRKPPEGEFIKKVSERLLLSDEDYEELCQKYKMVQMGENVYSRRKKVAEIIHSLSHIKNENNQSFSFKTNLNISDTSNLSTYYSQDDLIKNIQIILQYEVQQKSDLYIIAQPSNILNQILKYCVDTKGEISIQHIFCLDNIPIEKSNDNYNLDAFLYVSQLVIDYKNYQPFYYYDIKKSHINSTSVMPYVIISRNFVICTDSDFNTGLICKMDNYVSFYMNQFDNLRAKSKMLLTSLHDSPSIEAFYRNATLMNITYNYQSQIILCCDKKSFYDFVNGPDEFKKQACQLLEEIVQRHLNNKIENIFSEAGIKEFMATGKLLDFPEHLYTPISINSRKKMLTRMIQLLEDDVWDYRIVKNEYDMFLHQLCISGDSTHIDIQYAVDQSRCHISLDEKSLIFAFVDYIQYLYESNKVYTKEETIEILKKYL